MILGAAVLLAVLVLALRPLVIARPKVRLRWVFLTAPFVWALYFGAFRALVHVTQSDLPEPNFTTPIPFYAGAAVPLALATGALLAGVRRTHALVVAAGTLLVALAALNYHACFTEDAILLRRCLSFTEKRYEYNQVKTLKYVRDFRVLGVEVHRPRFVIWFDDGSRWTSDDGFRRTTAHDDMQAIHVVTGHSQVMLQQVQFAE
ncbi:MAG: hypothetical protein ACAI25_18275 [Planctomycetota bacterium]